MQLNTFILILNLNIIGTKLDVKFQIVGLSCGDEHTAVLTDSGRLFSFGSNEFGQLGLGHNTNVLKPSCVKSLKPDRVLRVACGKAHTVVAMESGKMYGFGSNSDGQLGIGRNPESINRPMEIHGGIGEPVKQLEAGSQHTMSLGKSGSVYDWGKELVLLPKNMGHYKITSLNNSKIPPSPF